MHDPKFEQEVQRRMHDLEFVPSESVWAGVRQGIAPRRRRRAVAIVWWLIPGMVLLAGGLVMYRHLTSTGGVAVVVPVVGKPAGAAGKGSVGSGIEGGGVEGSRATDGVEGDGSAKGDVTNGTGDEFEGIGTARSAWPGKVGQASEVGQAGQAGQAGAAREVGLAGVSSERYRPGLIGGIGSRRGVDAPALEWQPVKTAVTGIRRPRHPWTAGFAAGGGAASIYSRTGTGLASSPLPTNYSLGFGGNGNYSNYFGLPSTAQGTAYNTFAGSKQNKTYINAGYSYWAGIYGEKQLSRRLSVDIGLNLHYYSVRFETTDQVLFYAPPSSSSLFAATSITYSSTSANAYSGGELQTYYNHYYFLEVPATVQWRLNRSRSLPLFWRGGAVASYLMSSNGLYYDDATGNVAKDNGVVRRMQASIQSGLVVELPVRGLQIQAGPEVQYALTSMLMTGSGGGHMIYGGVRVALMR